MENYAEWQFEYLTQCVNIDQGTTVFDLSNGILTLAELLVPYLAQGKYQGNIVKKMTIRPDINTAVIESNADKRPYLDVIQNMQCTAEQEINVAWEHEVFRHLAVYDAMLCLANVGKVADRFFFAYNDQSQALERHINQKKSHPEVDFFYTEQQIATMCKHTGWQVSVAPVQTHPDGLTIMEAVK